MKRKILVILLAIACSFCFTFGVAACKDTDNDNKNNTEQGGTTNPGGDNTDNENGWTLERAYAVAVDLGYDSSLEEFLETIKGKDGVDGKDGVGIKSVKVNADGELIIVLSDETEINCGVVTGKNGKDGVDGKSAFEIWKEKYGDEDSTEEDFLNWLKGEDGKGVTPCEHTYTEWQVVLEPTCTSIGYSTRECAICGNVEYQFRAAIGHSVEEYIRSDRYTHVYICISCGIAIEERHIWDENGNCACGENDKYATTTFTVIVQYEDGTPIDGTKHRDGESWIMDALGFPANCARVQFCTVLADGSLGSCTNPVDIGKDGKAIVEIADILKLAEVVNTTTVELNILNVKGNGYDKGEGNALYGRFEITEIPTEIIVTLQFAK